jgi:lipopolysaccharide export LptBFGC system permease protein LptF
MIYKIQRHLFMRLLKSFVFFVALLFTTYIILDFCTKVADFSDSSSINYLFMLRFYGSELAKKAHLFIPICFSLACLLQFIKLSKTKEIVALLCSGLTYQKILAPFWVMGCILSIVLFLNRQYIIPPSRNFLESYRNDHVRTLKKVKNEEDQLFTLVLKDESKLIYQSYNPIKKRYFDLFWILSPQRILRIKYIDHTELGYKAQFIDELTRNQSGTLQKKHSFKELTLSKEWLQGAHFDKSLPIQTQKLDQLIHGLKNKEYLYSRDEIYTELLLVLIMNLAPLWLIAMQSPMLCQYSRQTSILFYVATQLLFFFCSSTILDGLGIISQRSIVSPWILIFIPTTIGLFFIFKRYKKKVV